MAETSNTNSGTSAKPVTHHLQIDGARVAIHDRGVMFSMADDSLIGKAGDALALLDTLRLHETQLREAARLDDERKRWEAATSVANNLLHASTPVQVLRISPSAFPGTDEYRSVIEVVVNTGQEVRDHTHGLEVRVADHGPYTQTFAEVAPGVILTATELKPRDTTSPSVAPAVTP